ncbi:hypothetical protein OIO90_003947 [Microbotryomycetes sp. JL221]|nr:hypothetical protein OIO90_003947 [Microbotryomycetes sp. JL221]
MPTSVGDVELERMSSRATTDFGTGGLNTPASERDILTTPGQNSDALAASETPQSRTEGFESYPDGGAQAWIQIACCFVLFFTSVGTIYAWGVSQDALEEAGVAPASTLAFIGSTQATFQAVLAIPTRRTVAAYGPRNCALVGGTLAGFGPILASFVTRSVPGLIFTQAFMFGIGQTLMFYCIATLPSTYFSRRRNLATGLTYSAGESRTTPRISQSNLTHGGVWFGLEGGFGGAAVSILTRELITKYGVPWAFRILGLMFLTMNLPAAWMLRSRSPRIPFSRKRDADKKLADDDDKTASKLVDFGLFKDIRFSLFFLASFIVVFPLFVPPFFLPLFARSAIGMSSSASAALLAGFNVASALGRIAFGVGADIYLGSVNAMLLCLMGFAISTLLIWPFASSIVPLALFTIINGFTAGGYFSLVPGFLTALFGSKVLPVAFPMLVTSFSFGYLMGSPVAGYLLEALGGPAAGFQAFKPAIFYSGGLSLISAVLVGGVRWKEGGSWRRKI